MALVKAVCEDFESAPISDEEKGLLRYIAKVNDTPAKVSQEDVDAAKAHGWSDQALFDAATVGSGPIHERRDLPSQSARLFAESTGMHRVFVNGVSIVEDGRPTDAMPGRLLHSGRDTETVTIPARR